MCAAFSDRSMTFYMLSGRQTARRTPLNRTRARRLRLASTLVLPSSVQIDLFDTRNPRCCVNLLEHAHLNWRSAAIADLTTEEAHELIRSVETLKVYRNDIGQEVLEAAITKHYAHINFGELRKGVKELDAP